MVGSFERILQSLNAAGVRYLVVGGVAVVLHGHLRTTTDLDLVVQLNPENVRRALAALELLGYLPVAPVAAAAFADPAMRAAWIAEKNMNVFALWAPDLPEVDLFVEEPFDFDRTHARSIPTPLRGTIAHVVSVADLIALKRTANRAQDQADIEALTSLEQAGPPS